MSRRLALHLGALVCALSLAATAGALPAQAASGNATGTVVSEGSNWFSVQTAGRRLGRINAMIAAADAVTRGDYPYVWGGGHIEAGVASAVAGGSRRHRNPRGYDCSGSVAAVLAGAGLWPAGAPVPNDAGVIAQLRAWHLIAPGAGTAPAEVTLYDDPGYHIFMSIDGRFFGTSDGGGGGNRNGGAGWLHDGAWDAGSRAYRRYHVLPSVLRDRTSYGHTLTFQVGSGSALAALQTGDRVAVSFAGLPTGIMVSRALSYPGALTTTGTVTALSTTSLTVLTASGSSLTLDAPQLVALAPSLAAGDAVSVTYTKRRATLTARLVKITATATSGSFDGTVSGLGTGTLTLQSTDGQTVVFFTTGVSGSLDSIAVGDVVTVDYTQLGDVYTAQAVSVEATAAAPGDPPPGDPPAGGAMRGGSTAGG